MRLQSPWNPRLADVPGRPHERLAAALAEDILAGRIGAGARLPPHRTLAFDLGVSIGTVTRAYAALQRRGLAQSEHGRGMFVSDAAPRAETRVDLSRNMPPQMLSERMLATILADVGRSLAAETFGSYIPPAGQPEHRLQLAHWLGETRLAVRPEHLLMTNGAQHALFIAGGIAGPRGAPIAVEALTYPGMLRAAQMHGRPLVPLEMDAEGATPAALERALTVGGARVAYLTPTLQNPTGATMSSARRRAVAEIARAHDAWIIEDEVYSVFAPEDLPTLASLAPERTFYITSLAKTLSPGLRIGVLAVPEPFVGPALSGLLATSSMANPVSCLMMEYCFSEGLAASVAQSIRLEARRRNQIARAILGDLIYGRQIDGMHLWLPMPRAAAERVVRGAGEMNVILPAASAFMADPTAAESGVRLCLGAPPAAALQPALQILARLIADDRQAEICAPALV